MIDVNAVSNCSCNDSKTKTLEESFLLKQNLSLGTHCPYGNYSRIKDQTEGTVCGVLGKVLEILNRIATWDDKRGLGYEADPRHVEIIKQQLVLGEAKVASTPGTKEEGRIATDHEEPLDEDQATRYRALTARCNYLSPDWFDVSFAAKELARSMSSPGWGDRGRFKLLARYLKDRPRAVK